MIVAAIGLSLMAAPAWDKLSTYDVIWNSPSQDAAGSMPIGNGEVVLNVWVEDKTGDILFYIARTDALSELSRFLKLGRVRVHFDPSPFKKARNFTHRLNLQKGKMEIAGSGAKLVLFVDSNAHVIYLNGTSAKPLKVTTTLECWRNAKRRLPEAEKLSSWSTHDAPFELWESADVFMPTKSDITWYHRNEWTITPDLLKNQSLVGAAGAFDPLLNRTFGGRMSGEGFNKTSPQTIESEAVSQFNIAVSTHAAVTKSADEWAKQLPKPVPANVAEKRTEAWWDAFWKRSWVFVNGDNQGVSVPKNAFKMRKGFDSNDDNRFPGEIDCWEWLDMPVTPNAKAMKGDSALPADAVRNQETDFKNGFTLSAWINPTEAKPGRIFDKMSAGGSDGFIFDTHPGTDLRLIVGNMTLVAPKCLKLNEWQLATATYDAKTGEAAIYLNAERVAHREPAQGSSVTRGYVLQRYVQAVQGRGAYPIKFNGGFYTVEPKAMGRDFNADWRNWGDCHWYQNLRHMYHPMMAQGDFEMMKPFFRLYESVRPIAETRTAIYHGAKGAYFPETMTITGLYSGGDYGWNREGKQPKDVDCGYWKYAWNQGPELLNLMLEYWEYTGDEKFLKNELLPMAKSVLEYFDTRFIKDPNRQIVLNPTQVVETYWSGVTNDMPSTAGLISVTNRLVSLPSSLVPSGLQAFFKKVQTSCPDLPLEERNGKKQLAPAQLYDKGTSNCENGELYGIWPFRVVSLLHPELIKQGINAYNARLNHLDNGWGYDGNAAALLGLTEESARILQVKCANSHPAYRWPATWGPNFDWLPDQNHGGNLLNTTNLMLLQCAPLSEGGKILLLPAWPKNWDVSFRLHAPGNTTVECVFKGGKVLTLKVTPESRRKDVVAP